MARFLWICVAGAAGRVPAAIGSRITQFNG
jgi:hypothetical protein